MADLTKEYFDKTIKDLKVDLKSYIKEENEELARMVNTGFEDVIKRLDFRERVEELERKMSKMEKALNLRL